MDGSTNKRKPFSSDFGEFELKKRVRTTESLEGDALKNGEEFVPLRTDRLHYGRESNRMTSYSQEDASSSYSAMSASSLSRREVLKLRREHQILVESDYTSPDDFNPEDIPNPILSFVHSGLEPLLIPILQCQNITTPTSIQMQVIPCVLRGRDLIALSETGSGKTLAFVLPMFSFLQQRLSTFVPFSSTTTKTTTTTPATEAQPFVLILAPTRELADQIAGVIHQLKISLQSFSDCFWFRVQNVVGGVPIETQIQQLSEGVEVLVATPGRLIDLLERKVVSLQRVGYLVIDEVDRLLEGGGSRTREGGTGGVASQPLEVQLRKILEHATGESSRQTLLFSATMPTSLERLARSAILNPIRVTVGKHGAVTTPTTITQNVIFVQPYNKKRRLLQVLRKTPSPPVLIFCNTHYSVDKLVGILRKEQFHVAGLHGELTQDLRFAIIKAFKEDRLDVLVATDLASRGLDVANVTHVILYDLPDTLETYIHRIGRTGRAGKEGASTSFLSLDCKIAKELKGFLSSCNQTIPRELDSDMGFGRVIPESAWDQFD